MKKLMTGNEAIARGAYEAGVRFAAAYPGTPSTEILENAALYKKDIIAEWAPNEKVALESTIGASLAGARALAAMKHVGLNVAADPLFTVSYTGIYGGLVIVVADEPGQHSSQNEQDNRNYAKAAKVPMLEPSDSNEAKDFTKVALDLSEKYDVPVLLRMTTRVCHSKGIVECQDREERDIIPYKKNVNKYVTVPAIAKKLRVNVEERQKKLLDFSNTTDLNFIEWNDTKLGVIASGMCYNYSKEVFGDKVSYLKIGFSHPLPTEKIKEFCSKVDKVYVIEENDPYIEDQVKMLGFNCLGKDVFPPYGEMLPEIIRKSVYGKTMPTFNYDEREVVARPPLLCAGCPHRGLFSQLGKRKNVMVSGDIGCYTLASSEPYNSMDTTICMGASISLGHGAQKIFDSQKDNKMRVVSVLGDSTFFHTGINSLIDVAYNKSNTINIILDNRITGMTGHQENPGSGYTLQGEKTNELSIKTIAEALGFKNIAVINPNDLNAVNNALDWALSLDEPSVIITRWPCALKKFSPEDKEEFSGAYTDKYAVDHDKCIGCKSCIRTGCPAISFNKETKKSTIDYNTCKGCSVCSQVCPVKAIGKVGE
jgi:indolepyruvate ferredoxin oxidoreductase alpha subunit